MEATDIRHFQYKRHWEQEGHSLVIRPAEPHDAQEIHRRLTRVVEEGVYLNETPDSLPDREEKREEIEDIREGGGMYTVVEVDGEIAGVALLRRGLEGTSDHTAKFRTWLVPGYRGLGLGTQLLEYTIEWARTHGVEKINLDVWDNNDRAIQLYEKYGFQVEGRRLKQAVIEGEYVDELYMGLFV
ncbi:GNAT family N-acetyltransferase [Salinithrix halophila]|uniref:GNAT family N-acetyltransferase n=1 Tax=Salinithrix halophila TaxID=1485204 RepID=A0ABV8JKL6_9BACL